MKKQGQLYLFMVCMLASSLLFAQVVTKSSTSPVSGTVCPKVSTYYEVSRPTGFGACKITWSVINGKITSGNGLPTVTVEWEDTPGAKGKVTATFSDCGTGNEGNNGVTASLEELILSVKGKSFGTYTNFVNIDYCTRAQVYIQVPSMVVDGTGGINQPPRTEVAYGWTLPTGPDGWREVGTGKTGFFGTSTNYITIEPINCAKPGIVKVEGVLIGIGLCDAAAPSAPATINLNGPAAFVSVVPESGYTGASACNTTPVTFYATTNVGCAVSYSWSYPQNWSLVPNSQVNNEITLTPSGTAEDGDLANPIKAKITFNCGSSVESGNYVPPYATPVLTGSNLICNSASFALQNAGTGSVTWLSSNTSIATVSSSGVVTRVSNANGEVTITAAFSCPVPAVTKTTWIGSPKINVPGRSDPGETGPMQFCQTYYYETQNKVELTGGGFISTVQYEWNIASNNFGYYTQGNTIHIQPHTLGTIAFGGRVSNACGWSDWAFFMYEVVDCNNPNPQSQYSIYPNPTSETLTIENSSLTQNSAFINDQETNANATVLTPPAYKLYNYKQKAVLSGVVYEHQTLDVSALKKGKYMLVITTGENTETHQIVLK